MGKRREKSRALRSLVWFCGVLAVVAVFLGAAALAQGKGGSALKPAGGAASSASGAGSPGASSKKDGATSRPAATEEPAPTEDPEAAERARKKAEAETMLADWRMILVSPVHPMPEDYTVEVSEALSDSTNNKLQVEAAEAFRAMKAAAAQAGVTLHLQSGYRSVKYQSTLYNNKTAYYEGQGYDHASALQKAATVVTPPGCSEHNCGLAADINTPSYTALDSGFANTAAYTWLCEHAVEYGFIERYPSDKQEVTGIIPEAWHWRYVGPENAAEIKASGLCLEEYVEQLQQDAAA